MSTQQVQQQVQQMPPDWVPRRRDYGGLRQVRKDEHNRKTFKGQDADEDLKMVVRTHPIFLIRPALPVLGVFVLLLLDLAMEIRLPDLGFAWGLAAAMFSLLFVVT